RPRGFWIQSEAADTKRSDRIATPYSFHVGESILMGKEARSQKPEARRTSALFCVAVCLLASGFFLLASLHAETLDKIVAVVDGRIITLSDVRQETAVRGILGEKAIDADAVIQQIIEGYLIESQLAGFPGINVTDEEVADAMAKLPKKDAVSARVLHDA